MKKFHIIFFLSLFAIFSYTGVNAQGVQDHRETYILFDQAIRLENTDLANGIEYLEQHITINEKHKFLKEPYFTEGSVIYYDEAYFDIPLKYNIYDDLLLVRIKNSGGESSFQLHKNKVEEFQINNQRFMNIQDEEKGIYGFHEILIEAENFSLFKKHIKKQKKLLDKDFTYFEFEEDDAEFVLYYLGDYHNINSEKELLRALPNHEKEIKAYYNNQNSLYKTDPDLFLFSLFQELSGEFSETKTFTN